MYIHQLSKWPEFSWDANCIAEKLGAIRYKQGRLIGRMENLGFSLREEAVLETMTLDVLKTSEIEGETLNIDQVRSSLASRLGMDIGALTPADRHVDGVVEMLLDATQQYLQPLSEERLFNWHSALFPTGRSGINKITVGRWRTDAKGPMQVVSGAIGRETVHFEAPSRDIIPMEITKFLNWIKTANHQDPVLKAAIAHLWFLTIHPFEDGNGRIARSITDLLLARSDNSAQRFYSMSAQIQRERRQYYDILEKTQKGDLDITNWLIWFLDCLDRALSATDTTLDKVLLKTRYWQLFATKKINDRQKLILNKLLDGFEGKLNTSKWAKITKVSNDTALRDILALVEENVLQQEDAGGRSTSYRLIDL